jgi:ribosomal-protein-serine acetyltransferase
MQLTLTSDDALLLRQITGSDAEALTALIEENRTYLRQWLPWLDSSTSISDTLRFIDRTMEQAFLDNGYTFGIICEERLAGVIGQHYLDRLNRQTELGYWLDARHQGRGIMTRCTSRLIDFAFNDQDCHRVILRCAAGNAKSRAVAERLGFVQEGILREAEWLYDHYVDLVVYSLLKSEWPAR